MPMDKKFWITFVVIFVLAMALGFVTHGLLLAGDYAAITPDVMRPLEEQEAKFMFQLLAHVFIAFGFTWIYREGHTPGKSWTTQGICFGLAFAFAANIPFFLIYHAVANFPLLLSLKQCVFDGLSVIVLGLAAAFVNKS
jgi:hypothetical protein